MGDKLNIAEAGLISDDARNQLQKRGVSEDTVDLYFQCLYTCDMKRFSPTETNEEEMKVFFKKSEEAITRLEREII